MTRIAAVTAILTVLLVTASAPMPLETGSTAPIPVAPAATPPMGWNSWNTFGCDIDEGKIRSVADALVSSGMRDAGYRYVVVDDCWYEPQRDSTGALRANAERFPSGMAALGDYLHERGFGFGLYMSPNVHTCAQHVGTYPGATGSGGHEYRDARTFAAWGVDYLKYDWCFGNGSPQNGRAAFSTMRDALSATGRPIVYSINPNSNFPGTPGETQDWRGIAHLTRTTEDIQPVWETGNRNTHPMGVRDIIDVNAAPTSRSGPGHWNDPDMLEVGVRDINGYPGLTPDENRTHLSMWAMLSAPLIAGNDPTTMTAHDRLMLTRREVIAVDQDPLGRPATRITGGDHQVWSRPLHDGTAVALYNRSDQAAQLATTVDDLGLPACDYQVRDLWEEHHWTVHHTITAPVPAHGTVLLHLSPQQCA